jgi:hypothetical protein
LSTRAISDRPDNPPLLEQLQVDRIAHGAIAGVVRVEVVADVVVGRIRVGWSGSRTAASKSITASK